MEYRNLVIGLIIGVVLGGSIGFNIQLNRESNLQDQILQLKNEIDSLENEIEDLQNEVNYISVYLTSLTPTEEESEEQPQTEFERLEITSAYCESGSTFCGGVSRDCWNITLDFRNTGNIEIEIIAASVNGKSIHGYGDYSSSFLDDNIRCFNSGWIPIDFANTEDGEYPTRYSIEPGVRDQLTITILQNPSSPGYSFTSGTTIEVSLRSEDGNTYMKMITLT